MFRTSRKLNTIVRIAAATPWSALLQRRRRRRSCRR